METPEAAARLGKTMGNYVTLEAPGLRQKNTDLQDRLSEVLARELLNLIQLPENLEESIFIVGLGNWNVTPDALGPRVMNELLVTRHMFKLGHEALGEGLRSVCALAPGVMGLTGIETSEIIHSLVTRFKPSMLIAIDALAAHRLERLHTTIQISDAGINPGSGVGNNRQSISKETIGIPVVAIGVPTVVDASTIAGAAMDALVESFRMRSAETAALGKVLGELNWDQRQELIREVLEPFVGRLMVTPKEVDELIEEISLTIGAGLNAALHPRIKAREPGKYLQ